MRVKTIDKLFEALRFFISILIAFAIALIIISLVSDDPVDSVKNFVFGPLESFQRFSNVLEQMVPYLFTGTAIAIMYRANLFNLAGEGAFFISGAFAAYFAINLSLPAVLSQIVIIAISAIVGMIVMLIPILLKVKWNANEAVSSIMINYILLFLGRFMLLRLMRDSTAIYNMSYKFNDNAKLPILLKQTRLHLGLVIGLITVLAAFIFLFKTKKGYEIRVVGSNPKFAKFSGINIKKTLILSGIVAGIIIGIGGASEILGMYSRFRWEELPGYGWDGVLVGTLAQLNPILVPLSSFFLAYLRIGADIVSRTSDLPVEFIAIIQALVIMLVGAQMFLASWKQRAIAWNANKTRKETIKND